LDGVELGEFTETLASVLQEISNLTCLTVVLIDGPALGAGMQLAAACDLRAATAESPIGIPAVKLGLAVDLWTIERIGREAGWNVARRILLTGEALLAGDLAGQFVHRLMSKDQALDECRQWCEQLSSLAPLSVRAHKLAIARAMAGPGMGRDEGLIENARLAAWASSDAAEGRQAFREKRAPRFTGH
jgi:enoyl-CoA hydratase